MHRRRALTLLALSPLSPDAARAADDMTEVLTRVTTPLGPFVVAVDPKVAPLTVANYLAYVDAGRLDGGSVYRIVTPANQPPETRHRIEVVQWGMHNDGAPPLAPIAHETTRATGLRHLDLTVSMARDAPGSAAAEFFICIGDQPELDFGGGRNPDGQGFAAFGRVVEGASTVRALYARATDEQFLKVPIPIGTVRRVAAVSARASSAGAGR